MREESTVHECKKSPTILKISLPLSKILNQKKLTSHENTPKYSEHYSCWLCYFESSNQKKTCIKIVTLEIKILHINDY